MCAEAATAASAHTHHWNEGFFLGRLPEIKIPISCQVFQDWVYERAKMLRKSNLSQDQERNLLKQQKHAFDYWQDLEAPGNEQRPLTTSPILRGPLIIQPCSRINGQPIQFNRIVALRTKGEADLARWV